MKKVVFAIFLLAFMVLAPCLSQASEIFSGGKAMVCGLMSHYVTSSGNFVQFAISVSNTTDVEVDCNITLYNQDGDTSSTSYGTVSEPNSSTASGSITITTGGEFTLPAHSTRHYCFNIASGMPNFAGYAVIEWTSSNTTIRKALLASMQRGSRNGSSYHSQQVLVNGGQLF